VKVLFFSPHAGIWQHAFTEALVAGALRAELVYVTCGGALSSYCVPMAARGLTSESAADDKARACAECRLNRDIIRRAFQFSSYDFESVLDDADERRVEALLESAPQDDLTRFEVDGVAIGRAALYEYLIQKKKTQIAFSDEEWRAFRPRLANALRSLLAAGKILDREAPARVVLYNSLYSVNAAWRGAAGVRKIPVYFLHAGPNLQRRLETLMVGRDSTLSWYNRALAAWPEYRSLPCSEEELSVVTDHFVELFRGTSVFAYSTAKSQQDLRGRFGIRDDQKLIAASMSSYDEYVAARAIGEVPDEATLLFPRQIEWVRALVDWFRSQLDKFLLIRVHPREFPNKREGTKSEHAALLERELADLPPNVRVNWPSDQLSIYDIAEHADVFLNAWSNAGKEMTLLGLPVVVYCPPVLQYPANLNYVGLTLESYFAAIQKALDDGWSFERTRVAYRWCVLEQVRAICDIGDGFEFSERPAQSFWERLRNAAFTIPGVRQQRDLARRPAKLKEESRLGEVILGGKSSPLDLPPLPRETATLDEETQALKRQVRRLMRALYPDGTRGGALQRRLQSVL
jgi:hypothetical protein